MEQFEYMVVENLRGPATAAEFCEWLNYRGRDGWQLLPSPLGSTALLFMRRIEAQQMAKPPDTPAKQPARGKRGRA